jgi:hypothetical protein
MKRIVFIFVLFSVNYFVISQNNDINIYISYLGKPVPEGFNQIDRATYTNDDNIVLYIQNGLVIASVIGMAFDYNHEASAWLADYYNYFENQNWIFIEGDTSGDLYIKNGILGMCYKPAKRDDGLIVAMVIFTKEEYQNLF